MKLEAIYDKGRLEFIQPVHFVRDRLRVVAEVPEQEMVKPRGEARAATLDGYARTLKT